MSDLCYIILSSLYKEKTRLLNFNLNHPYFKDNTLKKRSVDYKTIKFFCIGGLNSLTRKNIILIINTFYNIFKNNESIGSTYLKWELNVYIQGVEIPDII